MPWHEAYECDEYDRPNHRPRLQLHFRKLSKVIQSLARNVVHKRGEPLVGDAILCHYFDPHCPVFIRALLWLVRRPIMDPQHVSGDLSPVPSQLVGGSGGRKGTGSRLDEIRDEQ